REQPRDELRAVSGKLEQRLVHQMGDHVAAANVEDDRDLWLQRGDVGKVLLRADAEVNAAWTKRGDEIGDDELKPRLVRQEVIRTEVTARLREVAVELPQLTVAES